MAGSKEPQQSQVRKSHQQPWKIPAWPKADGFGKSVETAMEGVHNWRLAPLPPFEFFPGVVRQ
jgi:hypothetical protein